MAVGSGSTLALAARLRALDDASLVRLVAEREVRRSDIRDFFDLAEALLDRGSVQAALQRLDRPTLAMLAIAGELAETRAPTAEQLADRLGVPVAEVLDRIDAAVAVGLLGSESGRYAPWDAVIEQLTAWPAFGLPSRADLAAPTTPPEVDPSDAADPRFVDRGAGDHAFGTVAALTEILVDLRDRPARVLARGALALPDARRLGERAAADPGDVDLLLEIARLGGLARADGSAWAASTASETWLTQARAERWRVLAAGWLHALPEELRELLVGRTTAVWGSALLERLAWLYPAGGDWVIDRAATASRIAELLGIQSASTTSTAGRALLEHGAEAAAAAMARSFPAEVDRVYLQHDLSVIAPGPLRGDLDHRLRGIATTEARGIASSFRFTATSLHGALLAGETETGIREFLSSLSLTGIPQPLDYLIAEVARRFGSLRVGSLPSGGSYLRSADTDLLGQVAVDRALSGLGLTRLDDERLVSRLDVDLVAGVLAEARYPVAVEDATGEIVRARPARRTADGTVVAEDDAAVLVARVRSGATAPEEDERAWLTRQIELAVKGRLPVQVTVRLPDESLAEYLLEPAGLAGGRLRALDRRADIERTLPISSIIAVSAPEGPPE